MIRIDVAPHAAFGRAGGLGQGDGGRRRDLFLLGLRECGDARFDEATFTRLSNLTNAYLAFAALEISKPVASYGDALSAAAMPMAPVSPAADGAGLGSRVRAP